MSLLRRCTWRLVKLISRTSAVVPAKATQSLLRIGVDRYACRELDPRFSGDDRIWNQ